MPHVGSAHDLIELGVLMERARDLLEQYSGQEMLDLGVEPEFPVAQLVTAPAMSGLEKQAEPVEVERTPAGRVIGTDCRVLFHAVAALFTQLGFDVVDDEVFGNLVIARVVEPTTSLRGVGRVLTDLGQNPPGCSTLGRTLGRATARGYRERIAAACLAHATRHRDLSLVLYEVTTLYFEADKGRRPPQGRLLHRTTGRPADRRRSAGRPCRVCVAGQLL